MTSTRTIIFRKCRRPSSTCGRWTPQPSWEALPRRQQLVTCRYAGVAAPLTTCAAPPTGYDSFVSCNAPFVSPKHAGDWLHRIVGRVLSWTGQWAWRVYHPGPWLRGLSIPFGDESGRQPNVCWQVFLDVAIPPPQRDPKQKTGAWQEVNLAGTSPLRMCISSKVTTPKPKAICTSLSPAPTGCAALGTYMGSPVAFTAKQLSHAMSPCRRPCIRALRQFCRFSRSSRSRKVRCWRLRPRVKHAPCICRKVCFLLRVAMFLQHGRDMPASMCSMPCHGPSGDRAPGGGNRPSCRGSRTSQKGKRTLAKPCVVPLRRPSTRMSLGPPGVVQVRHDSIAQ